MYTYYRYKYMYRYIYIYICIYIAAYYLNVRLEWRRTRSTTSIPAGHAQAKKQETELAYKPTTYPKVIYLDKNARW